MARVLIVDDHPVLRRGLSSLIDAEPDVTVSAEASTGDEALRHLAEQSVDLVLLDLSLPDMTGLDLLEKLADRWPDTPALVLSRHDEALYAEQALQAGARGYLMKSRCVDQVRAAIQRVLRGGVYLSEQMTQRMLQGVAGGFSAEGESPVDRLSEREQEVFDLIGRGISTRHIAQRLDLSVKTIESHRTSIKRKLGLRDANELLRYAVAWALQQ